MGIQAFEQKLFKLNELKTKDYMDNFNLSDLNGKKIAVDISNFLFRFIIKHNCYYLTLFLNLCMTFKKYNIQCIYVFDGNAPKEKNKVLEKRKRVRNKNIEKLSEYIKELKDFNNDVIKNSKVSETHFIEEKYVQEKEKNIKKNIIKCQKKTHKITKEHIKEIKKLLDLLKISYVHINYEADIVCAHLVKNNIVDACLTNDNDLVCYQCPIVLKDYNFHNKTVNMLDIKKLSKLLNINLNQLTFLLVLFGCDYSSAINFDTLKEIYDLLLNNIPFDEIINKYFSNNERVLNAYKLFVSNITFNKNKDIKYLKYIDTKFNKIDKECLEKYILDISKKEDIRIQYKKDYLGLLNNYTDVYYYKFNEM